MPPCVFHRIKIILIIKEVTLESSLKSILLTSNLDFRKYVDKINLNCKQKIFSSSLNSEHTNNNILRSEPSYCEWESHFYETRETTKKKDG